MVLAALDYAIRQVAPETLVKRSVKLDDGSIRVRGIDGERIAIRESEGVFVVGAGKACSRMTSALCSILGSHVIAGAITVPYGDQKTRVPAAVRVTEASHPIPDSSGLEGSRRILKIISKIFVHLSS